MFIIRQNGRFTYSTLKIDKMNEMISIASISIFQLHLCWKINFSLSYSIVYYMLSFASDISILGFI